MYQAGMIEGSISVEDPRRPGEILRLHGVVGQQLLVEFLRDRSRSDSIQRPDRGHERDTDHQP